MPKKASISAISVPFQVLFKGLARLAAQA